MTYTTALTGIKITNYTRYSTADLKALIDAVEAKTGQPKPLFSTYVKSNAGENYVPEYIFRDYTGAVQHHYTYDTAVRRQLGRVFVARMRWREPLTFRLLPHDRLHENPLEDLLKSAGHQTPTIPHEMLLELTKRIQTLYMYWMARGSYRTPAPDTDISGLHLRIMKRRDAGSSKRDSKVVAKERADRHLRSSHALRKTSAKLVEHLDCKATALSMAAGKLAFQTDIAERVAKVRACLLEVENELDRVTKLMREEAG